MKLARPWRSTRIETGDGLLVIGTPEKLKILVEHFFPDSDYSENEELEIFKKHTAKHPATK